MADEDAASSPKKRSSMLMTIAIVLAVAVVEGGAFFVVVKFMGGGPEPSYGAEGEHMLAGEGQVERESLAEVVVLENFKVPNNKTGQTTIYDFDISVGVPESRQEEVLQIVKTRDAELRDRVFQIIRQARPRVLEEDDFGTLRLLLKHALSEIVGDEEVIQRVLIPRWLPIVTGG